MNTLGALWRYYFKNGSFYVYLDIKETHLNAQCFQVSVVMSFRRIYEMKPCISKMIPIEFAVRLGIKSLICSLWKSLSAVVEIGKKTKNEWSLRT